jgi:serine/threonine protein kinase
MGEVLLAEDTKQHNRKVALKILPSHLMSDEGKVRRFKHEARAILALNHPNILTVFEIGETHDTHYIATEFIDGETLRHWLWRNRIKVDEALGIAIQVAMALEAAHAAGIVHRDIKPENIMLRHDRFVRDRFVKVLDFGLAKLTERESPPSDQEAVTMAITNTNPGSVLGTSGYMSPEQAQGETVDARTDIFSVGVVIYEMVAGKAPFSGPTESHVRVSIIDQEPSPLAQQAAHVPRQLERIVSKALAKDRSKRYQTITDLKLDLEQLREELTVSASEHEDIESTIDTQVTDSGRGRSTAGRAAHAETIAVGAVTVTEGAPVVSKVSRVKTTVLIGAIVAVMALIAGVAYVKYSRPMINSVAILPFVNDSGDANAEYLSDGITESIINSLSRLPGLKVMSRNAVFRFKG